MCSGAEPPQGEKHNSYRLAMAKKADANNRAAAPALSGSPTENNSPRPASPTAAGPRKRAAAAPKPAKFSQSEIALKAYYIAEARRKMGLPGDEASDWLEAERQLKGGKAPAKKTVAKASRV